MLNRNNFFLKKWTFKKTEIVCQKKKRDSKRENGEGERSDGFVQ